MEFKKNDIIRVTVEDVTADGEGIGKVDGFALFIKDTIPGDVVTAKIIKLKKNYGYGKVEKVESPSLFRVEAKCPCHVQCGGCMLQTMDYAKQLEFKEKKIKADLVRIGGFDKDFIDEKTDPIIGMEDPYRYRNKAQYPVGRNKDKNAVTGFYAGHSHRIIENTDCILGPEENKEILEIIMDHVKKENISVYDEETGKGLLRHILIRKGFTKKEIMICFVINKKVKAGDKELLPGIDKLVERLSQISGMTSISASINTEKNNVIMGKTIVSIWGKDTIKDTISVRDMEKEGFPKTGEELEFEISPLSFYQVNPIQTEKLYSLALDYAGLTGKETVWDLYCGIGTISLFMAGKAKRVCGVEIVDRAIKDAEKNALRNNIKNAVFYTGKAEEILPAYYDGKMGETKFKNPDVIVVDPPRKGCDKACLDTMLQMKPDRIVYVSCNPASLARDLRILCDGGYEIKKVRGVDQFPQTVHVETVCLLSRKAPV
ncbi:MAG: 23S rRNA (uracil(1939)-C(5))-methyltransferase RlmD [Lachnospiraceae bacterium]|nr:23S rRNA (uracil(1939)-C(5))-methyltransferase RlmD [Lachnospiraceae bacterium]